jgi:hypothetical protein
MEDPDEHILPFRLCQYVVSIRQSFFQSLRSLRFNTQA